jgi:hypothetical protein
MSSERQSEGDLTPGVDTVPHNPTSATRPVVELLETPPSLRSLSPLSMNSELAPLSLGESSPNGVSHDQQDLPRTQVLFGQPSYVPELPSTPCDQPNFWRRPPLTHKHSRVSEDSQVRKRNSQQDEEPVAQPAVFDTVEQVKR